MSIDTNAANAAADAITYPVTSENRNAVRKYLTAVGVPYSIAGRLNLAELARIADKAAERYSNPEAHFEAAAMATAMTIDEPAAAEPAFPALNLEPETAAFFNLTPTPTPAPMTTQTNPDDAAARLAAALRELTAAAPAAAPLDEERVIDLIRTHAPKAEPREIVVKIADRPAVTISRQHYKFPLLLATIAAKVPAFLVGPAGTGKTSAAHAAANALGLPFYAISVGPMTSKSDLFGMRDASGHYHESDLVKAATRGGVFLFDELDAGNAATMTSINMLLANGSFSTPDGMREKSPDFVPVFALNTYGTGASREYVGRNQLDAATLDRGAFLDWPLDASLESSFLGIDETAPAFNLSEGGAATAGAWLDKIRAVRSAAALHKIRHIVSPRAAIYGMQLAAAGVGCKHAAAALLRKGLDDATAAKLGLE
jgi:hypothetical protein